MHTMIARAAYNSPADGSVPPARALDPARSALTSSEGITLASPLPSCLWRSSQRVTPVLEHGRYDISASCFHRDVQERVTPGVFRVGVRAHLEEARTSRPNFSAARCDGGNRRHPPCRGPRSLLTRTSAHAI